MPARRSVDWTFISQEEGGQQLRGYVPMPDTSQSGVTIATGVDLGQRTPQEIDALEIPGPLKDRLRPFATLKRGAAVAALDETPLLISRDEASQLDRAVKSEALAGLRAVYDAAIAPDCPCFDDLPGPAQTTIASVAFQYGTDLPRRTPRFWRAVTAQDWLAAVSELRDFQDRFAKRRNREADLIETLLA